MKKAEENTLTISNFTGRLTRYNIGDINSGYAKYPTTYGNDPFSNPTNLTWFESPTQIDAAGSVITDLIMAQRPRLESGITYVYAIGHTGRVYKIQVNNPATYNPNYDNPVLLTTLTINTPTFKYGASLTFFGATEKMFIGHDKGFTSLNFDGTGEAFIGVEGSYTASVPRPASIMGQYLYGGNGKNLVQILAGGTVGSYGVLSPALPVGSYVRDLDVSPDGNYLQITSSKLAPPDLTSTTQDTSSLSSSDSYQFLWNGQVDGNNSGAVSSYTTFNSYSNNANLSFGQHSFTMGYDLGSVAIYSQGQKLVTLQTSISPNFNALFSTGNLMGFASPESADSFLKGALIVYGQYDKEIPEGLFRFFRATATAPQTDIIQIPSCAIVSNLFYGSSSAGYTGNVVGSAKLYFSTLEQGNSAAYRFYKFTTVPTGLGTAIGGVYETQTQLFSKKAKTNQIRVYTEPLVANNSFKIELIGSGGTVIPNSTTTFTVGTNASAGQDYLWCNPAVAPTYALGVRITNLGSVNMVFNKVEVDYTLGGI